LASGPTFCFANAQQATNVGPAIDLVVGGQGAFFLAIAIWQVGGQWPSAQLIAIATCQPVALLVPRCQTRLEISCTSVQAFANSN